MTSSSTTPRRPAFNTLRRAATVAAAVLGVGLSAAEARAQTIVYLLRHAEPVQPAMGAEPSRDPVLSTAGKDRATALVHVLRQAGITDILSTDYHRTQETVAPLAEALGLTVKSYDPRALDDLAARLKGAPGRYVVAGHSNTTPQLVAALGGDGGEPIDEAHEFDRLYQVVIGKDGSVTTTLLRYGPTSGS